MTPHFHTLGRILLAQYILEIPVAQVMEPRHIAICLFTCASTRAVHLELTSARRMSVDAFILAFRRFIGWWGLPVTLLSDSAKSFKASSKEIQSICRSPEVFRYLADQHTS